MTKRVIIISIVVIAIILFFGAILSIPLLLGVDNINPTCGNGIQDEGEDKITCAEDFGEMESKCGNNVCDNNENMQNCPGDCGEIISCGNANCDVSESRQTCPEDCGLPTPTCGNNICEITELINEFETCNEDCTISCGDGICSDEEVCSQDCDGTKKWIQEYNYMRKSAGIEDRYLQMEFDYDYDKQNIQNLINNARNENNAKDATKNIGKAVFQAVDYNAELSTGRDCTTAKASEILDRGWGWCSTMSKVDIAALRGLGIAARTAQGCLTFQEACARFAVIQGILLPKTIPVIVENGQYVVGGGLHGWVEVWLPSEGWVLLEATNGALFETQCVNYARLKESIRVDREDFCFIQDETFVQFCAEF